MAGRIHWDHNDGIFRYGHWVDDVQTGHIDQSNTSDMKIEKEPFSLELFREILPLAQKCWHESTVIKAETCAFYGARDFDVEPDIEEYQRLANLGGLIIMTLRGYGRLVGYATGILYRSMHHKKVTCALGDTIYIEPEFRAYGPQLAERFEQELAIAGAAIIGWPTTVNGPIYKMLQARGYVGDDVVMEKLLCALPQQ